MILFYPSDAMSGSLSMRHLSIRQDKERLELYVELIMQTNRTILEGLEKDALKHQDACMILLSISRSRKSSMSILATSGLYSVKQSSCFVMVSLSFMLILPFLSMPNGFIIPKQFFKVNRCRGIDIFF